MWTRTDDPEADFYDWDADCARRERERERIIHICDCCNDEITTNEALCLDGVWYCVDCEDEVKDAWWQEFRQEHLREVDDE